MLEIYFSDVLESFRKREGKKFARSGWNGKGMWIDGQFPDEHSKMTVSYLYMNVPMESQEGMSAHTRRMPWVPSAVDMFANDWELVVE